MAAIVLLLPLAGFLIVSFRMQRLELKALLLPLTIHLFVSGFILPKQFRFIVFLVVGVEVLATLIALFLFYRYIFRKRMSPSCQLQGDLFKDFRSYAMQHPVLRLAFGEIVIIYYLSQSFRRRPLEYNGEDFYQQKDQIQNWLAVLLGLTIFLILEMVAVHLLVSSFSPMAAWIVLGLELYTLAWLWGDFQALRLRPTSLKDGILFVNNGFRASAAIPVADIVSIELGLRETQALKLDNVFNAAVRHQVNLRVSLKKPVTVHRLFNLKREASIVLLSLDDPEYLTDRLQKLTGHA